MCHLSGGPAEEFEMRKLYWEEDRMATRVDLDLKSESWRLGYFFDYLNGPLEFVGRHGFGDMKFPDLTLEEAKKVVEAIVLLEG